MDYRLITTPETEKDIEIAILWYIEIQDNLAQRFIRDLRFTRNHIQQNPQKTQVRYDNIRIAFLKKFPFGIHYRFENNTITIIAVFHTSEDPQKWGKRLLIPNDHQNR